MEAADTHLLRIVEAARLKVLDGSVHVVVVVRIVLEGIDLVGEAVLQGLTEVDERLVRVEGTVGVGSVEEPASRLFLRHDVDDAAQCVRSKADGDDTLVDFNAFGEADGDVVQSE